MVFRFPSNVLISHLKAAARFAATDDTRPEMCAIRLEAHGKNEARFFSTDGARLWASIVELENVCKGRGVVLITRAAAIQLATKYLDKKGGEVVVEVDSETLGVGVTKADGGVHIFRALDTKAIGKDFPDLSSVFKPLVSETTPRVAVSVDTRYFAEAAQSFADIRDPALMKEHGASIRFIPGQSHFDPVVVSAVGVPALVVLMPTYSQPYPEAVEHAAGLIAKFGPVSTEPVIPSRKKAK